MTTDHNNVVTCSITELDEEETSNLYIKTRDVSDNERDEVSLSCNDLDLLQLIAKANRSRYCKVDTHHDKWICRYDADCFEFDNT